MKRKRIGIDARLFEPEHTGIGGYIKNLINRIPALDTENEYVIFLHPETHNSWTPPSHNVKKIASNAHWYGYREQTLFPLSLYAKRLDLIHFPHFNVPLCYRKKHIVTIHDITPKIFHGHRMSSPVRRWGFNAVFNGAVRNADHIITVSNYTKNDLIKECGVDSSDISVIYNGFDSVYTDEQNYDTIQKEYGIATPYLLYVGVWRNHKNLTALIEAFQILKTRYCQNIQLVLASKELDTYPEPRECIRKYGLERDVIITGYIPEKTLHSLYTHALAYILPSLYEGFGLTGLEAMTAGIPVIASRATVLPEIYGDAAAYFDPLSPDDMAKNIHHVITDSAVRQQLVQRGHQHTKRFSWDACAKDTVTCYHTLLSEQ